MSPVRMQHFIRYLCALLLNGAWTIWLCQGEYLFCRSADTAKSRYPSFHTGYQHFGSRSKYLDGPSRFSWNKAIMRWVFQSLPRPVRFTLDVPYESGSPTPLKGCVVRVADHPRCSRPSPVRFTSSFCQICGYSQPPPRGGGINGLGLMSGLVPNLP